MRESDFECLDNTGVNAPVTMFPGSGSVNISVPETDSLAGPDSPALNFRLAGDLAVFESMSCPSCTQVTKEAMSRRAIPHKLGQGMLQSPRQHRCKRLKASGSPYPVGKGPYQIVAADFNGDGKLDLAVANLTDGTVPILLQQ